MTRKAKVFLGGTCNGSTWREEMIRFLDEYGIDYFDPVVDDWNEEAKAREREEREGCDFCLYCITPKMKGVYSIAEVVDDSNKRPDKTILVLKGEGVLGFDDDMWSSLESISDLLRRNGSKVFYSLYRAASWISAKTNNGE